ncbi:protein-disulfide reductase DsbD family protein [Aureispira anguillae]|uniref:Thioredoxin family protein n=1 Tax=Aureispira anguillae TaxID=2864201 RepID=A0A915YJF7_9BACT|nr:thioredoxin family protein [Aureispira anguillae]BDS13953.1 thioredoxin family protein [Aureispira anguillae]
MRIILSTLLLLSLVSFNLLGQDSPVKYTWEAKALGENEYELVFKAKIQDGWYTYSQYLESEDGPIATSINFESNNETKVGKATEKTSKPAYKVSGFDEMFDMNITKYKKNLEIKQKIKVTDPNKKVSGYLEYMTCDDTKCMPPTAVEFEFVPSSIEGAATTDKAEVVPTETPVEQPTETPSDHPAPTVDPNKPVNWVIKFNKISEDEVDLIATATIGEGWYVYSQTLESEDGPIPTTINFEGEAVVEEVSNVESTSVPENKLKMMDEVFDMELTKFKHDLTITQRIKVKDPKTPIIGYLNYMTCDATKCMPPTDVEFNFSFKGGDIPVGESFNPYSEDGVYTPANPTLIETNLNPIGNCNGNGVINKTANVASMGWLTIFLLGFAGGFVALLTPCVFPMIPMTVSLFSKGKKKSKAESIKNALLFGASIIVIYVSLGLVITGVFGADALNQLSTHWLMNLTFFLLFTVFAVSFFGYFEITLPSSWANKADQASMKGGFLGTFFGAFSICLVSFSCTGPIIGTLLVEAVKEGFLAPAIGMLGFSIALALPFALFAAFPSWLQSLPNSGSWMTTMKVILGFIELALGLKFLSTADLTQHWGIMPYELFIGLWGIIFGAMAIYLFGLIRFPHDNPNAKISNPRKGLGVLASLLTVYIFSGFMTNAKGTFVTPSLLSGLAPAVCYSYVKPCDCPATLDECFHDYYEALAYAKKVNKPLLVDFTGYGCVNCRKMEDNVWTKKKVNDIIRNEYVLVSLYVDDREKLDKTLVTPNGKKIRNVGNKWAEFQEVNFVTQSQPYYVLVNTKEEVLNTPVGYTPDEKEYIDFLNCGVKQFKESMK